MIETDGVSMNTDNRFSVESYDGFYGDTVFCHNSTGLLYIQDEGFSTGEPYIVEVEAYTVETTKYRHVK